MAKKSMADIWKQMEKAHGVEGLYAGDSSMTTYSEVIPSGSYALDDILGIWGLPRGHIVQYAGFESSGKTLMALCAIAEWQKKDPENWAMFIDAEFSFQADWATALGCDNSRIYVYRENKGASIFERLVGIPGKRGLDGLVKKVKPGILDIELETGGTGLGIIVLDSVAAMQPPAEEACKPGKDSMALMSRFLPPELRKLTPLLTATGVTFIVINQVRFTPGVMYGDPTMTPGGTALKHAASIMVNFGAIKSAESYILDENKERIGHKIRCKITKNKKAPPFRVAELTIKYTEGIINKYEELRDIAARYGVIQRPNNKSWELDGIKYNGKDAIAEFIKSNPDVQISLLEKSKEAKKNYVGPIILEPETENDETNQEDIDK